MKKHFRIPLMWLEYGHVWVEAEDEEQAKEIALGPDYPLPEGNYVDESVMIDEDCPIEVQVIKEDWDDEN